MATTTLTSKFQKITVPSDTDQHEIDFDDMLETPFGFAQVEWLSGAGIQLSSGVDIDADSASLTIDQKKYILEIRRGTTLKFQGAAGDEEFNVCITR